MWACSMYSGHSPTFRHLTALVPSIWWQSCFCEYFPTSAVTFFRDATTFCRSTEWELRSNTSDHALHLCGALWVGAMGWGRRRAWQAIWENITLSCKDQRRKTEKELMGGSRSPSCCCCPGMGWRQRRVELENVNNSWCWHLRAGRNFFPSSTLWLESWCSVWPIYF